MLMAEVILRLFPLVVDINLTKRSRFLPRNSLLALLKSFYPRLHMRYPFGGVVQIKTNLMTFNSLVSIHSLVSIDCGFLIQLVFCKKKKKLCGLLVLK